MGGTVAVESAEGAGSTFSLELPRGEDRQPKEAEPSGSRIEDAGTVRTVLYIEDQVANQRLIERILQRRPDVTLLSAMQGSLGIEIARRHRPDLILLDLNLPDISGEEVLLQLHAESHLRTVPVVFISADASERVRKRILGMGAREFLTKPIDISLFLRTVDACLERV